MKFLRDLFVRHRAKLGARDIFKYIGPGFLVTVGFIDPGNWASGLAAGALYGYRLLWVVTGSTLLLILLQHNAAHLGIALARHLVDCLADAVLLVVHRRDRIVRVFLMLGDVDFPMPLMRAAVVPLMGVSSSRLSPGSVRWWAGMVMRCGWDSVVSSILSIEKK